MHHRNRILRRVAALLSDGASTFDHIVFDTAPTGHTLRLLSLPQAWSGFLAGNDRGASCLGPHSGLKMQEERFKAALDALSDPARTTVVLVTRPDRGAIAEAARTSEELRGLGLNNQRLVVNEYELDVLRQRSYEARIQKVKRGELVSHCPIGFIKGEDSVLEKDPDQRMQSVIGLVFCKFMELGSVRQTLQWFLEHDIAVPRRELHGDTRWKAPSYSWMHRVLVHPAYGGVYAYGRTANMTCYEDGVPKQRARRRPQDQWVALIRDAHILG